TFAPEIASPQSNSHFINPLSVTQIGRSGIIDNGASPKVYGYFFSVRASKHPLAYTDTNEEHMCFFGEGEQMLACGKGMSLLLKYLLNTNSGASL
ncbi:hypothetical protein LINPERPRIM_LOCUS32971, partial [Linum perenne]